MIGVTDLATKIIDGRILRKRVSQVVGKHGMNITQFLALREIDGGNRTVTEIARKFGVDVPLITISCRPLIAAGLIGKSATNVDRREKVLHLTSEGHERLAGIIKDLERL